MNAIAFTQEPDRHIRSQNISALAMLAEHRVAAGDHATLLSIMFTNLPGGLAGKMAQMRDGIDRLYRTMLTRLVRDPTRVREPGGLPIFLGGLDRPTATRRILSLREAAINEGMHAHAVLSPPACRLSVPLDQHFRDCQPLYLRDRRLMRVDARPIRHSPDRAVGYCFKSIERGTVPYDDGVIILPRSINEVRRSTPNHA
jgi:hypothetical protein